MGPFRLVRQDTVASTNEEVKRAIEAGELEGLVVRARRQTGGYGRQGRAWASPAGGLYQSVLLRPDVPADRIATLALVVALATRSAVLDATFAQPSSVLVKWPNDVLAVQGDAASDADGAAGAGAAGSTAGKLAGISCELHAGGVCVGIGVNVLRPADPEAAAAALGRQVAYAADLVEPARCGRQAAALADMVDRLGDAVLRELARSCELWRAEGFAPFAAQFRACSYLAGRSVRIADIHGNVLCEGIAQDVDERGRLQVRTHAGVVPVSSGEAHLI